ncbi:hypothetical protein CRM22_003464 [Opisthorchis felineus]|uniref:Sodium/potassium-transporting ATPase subunit beta n=1 Tax=Opisthorchis felineus TaxID=147828 RepID=A0A4S2M129_OPIFE|nr:hypothetical protein CRM22_003464 [Opisthorchis felineus]
MSMQEFSDNLSTLSYVSRRRIPLWLYDPKKKAILGRTASSWALCILFYVVYYLCLAGFFMGMMMVFLHTQVPDDEPARSGMHSILQLQPGVGFRPMVDVQKSLIKFARTDPQSFLVYTENIDAFLETYRVVNAKPENQFASCADGVKSPSDPEKVCKFPLEQLGVCNAEEKYGYPEGKPCVILKLNKIFGWLPSIENLDVAPNALINCTGQNPADVENLGELRYFPEAAVNGKKYGYFDSIYFPFVGQPGYLGPLVAVKFENTRRNVAILVECKLRNLNNALDTQLAFEIMVN